MNPRSNFDFSKELQDIRSQNRFRELRLHLGASSPWVQTPNGNVLQFCSNDYLGLCSDERIANHGYEVAQSYGSGASGSRLLSGNFEIHEEIERAFAQFVNARAALFFSSGYMVNIGVIPVLAGENDLILSDVLNHASMIDGCRLSRAKVITFEHRNVSHLRDQLQSNRKQFRRAWILTEGVFSMEGTLAPLPDYEALCEEFDCGLYLDDAHGVGVLGANGQGTPEHFNLSLQKPNWIYVGTLGKAFGCAGAFVASSVEIRSLLINRCRSFIYSTAPSPLLCGAVDKAIEIVQQESWRREDLWRRCETFEASMQSKPDVLTNSFQHSPIFPVLLGTENEALRVSGALFKAHIYVPAIRPPTVPENACRLRFSLTSAHTKEDIQKAIDELLKVLSDA